MHLTSSHFFDVHNIELRTRPESEPRRQYCGNTILPLSNTSLWRCAPAICYADPTAPLAGTNLFDNLSLFQPNSWNIYKQSSSIKKSISPISAEASYTCSAGQSESKTLRPRVASRLALVLAPRLSHCHADPVFDRHVSSSSVSPNPARGLLGLPHKLI